MALSLNVPQSKKSSGQRRPRGLRLPTEPDLRVTYPAPHAKHPHFLISNQCSLFSFDLICKSISWINHLLGYARSTAFVCDNAQRFLLEKQAAAALLRDIPRFINL